MNSKFSNAINQANHCPECYVIECLIAVIALNPPTLSVDFLQHQL